MPSQNIKGNRAMLDDETRGKFKAMGQAWQLLNALSNLNQPYIFDDKLLEDAARLRRKVLNRLYNQGWAILPKDDGEFEIGMPPGYLEPNRKSFR